MLRCFLLAAAVAIGGYALALCWPGGTSMMAEFKQEIMAEMKEKDDAFKEEMKKKEEALADFMAEMQKKDEMIAALKGKTDHKQVQMSAGGEVVELVSAAGFKALETRVEACKKGLAAQDAKIGALRDKPTPPNPPATARPPAAARRQLSSATGDETEIAITGRKATLSFNSRTPDLTPTSLTGEGGGKLTCSGELHATDFVTAEGGSITERIEALRENFTDELEAVRKFVSGFRPRCLLRSSRLPRPRHPAQDGTWQAMARAARVLVLPCGGAPMHRVRATRSQL